MKFNIKNALNDENAYKIISDVSNVNILEKNIGAINIRKNGKSCYRTSTENAKIEQMEDKDGLIITIKENTPYEIIQIPVVVSVGDYTDTVYNDFIIKENSNVLIIAGCGVHNCSDKQSSHNGIHRFLIGKNSKVKYMEKHIGYGDKKSLKILNPITVLHLDENSYFEMETIQLGGVNTSNRVTRAELDENSTCIITEKILTEDDAIANTEFYMNLNGKNSSVKITSRSVACENSSQTFLSDVKGNNKCYAHIECDAIIQDNAKVTAIPKITANVVDANLIHEASIGKIAGAQLTKLMTLGLSEEEAEKIIIDGFLK